MVKIVNVTKTKKKTPVQLYWELDYQEDKLVSDINTLRRQLDAVRKIKKEVKEKRIKKIACNK